VRKGKVESGVGHVQRTPLKGLRFWPIHASMAQPNARVTAVFAEERSTLLPVRLEPFRYRYGKRTVHLDGCVEVEAAYCGSPPRWIGRPVQVQWDDRHVRLLNPLTGELLREHLPHVAGIASKRKTAQSEPRWRIHRDSRASTDDARPHSRLTRISI
jgi:hypothetical protein